MEEQSGKTNEAIGKYQFYTKKIEKILMIVFLLLFFISFNQSIFSPYSIIFYGLSVVCILYYFIWFRKKTEYIIIESNSMLISRGLFLNVEKISNESIKKVNISDKKIEILFLKDGIEDKVIIFNVLLEDKDRIKIVRHLQSIAMPGENAT